MFKIAISMPKPRNPVAQAARLRRAGAHRAAEGSRRRRAAHELQLEIDRFERPSP